MQQPTLYDRIGPENLKALVDRFYDLVFVDEELKELFHTDKDIIKDKQNKFLTQFLGGPPLYSEEHGHPRLRARHMPFNITQDKAIAWLKCMSAAIDTLPIDEELKNELFDRFPKTAFFMVNTE